MDDNEYINAISFICRDCERLFIVYYTDSEAENDELPYCPVCQSENIRYAS